MRYSAVELNPDAEARNRNKITVSGVEWKIGVELPEEASN